MRCWSGGCLQGLSLNPKPHTLNSEGFSIPTLKPVPPKKLWEWAGVEEFRNQQDM